ncbi:unnamed protein product [Rodentolepis nana]|uniref:BHLH domain-containing protein n=1 Tax=Rodentolepis nana TaxID=102285 RepID=A0A0R3U0S1_RODNA|nr:unnamed protein product [Rodentolepis nana]
MKMDFAEYFSLFRPNGNQQIPPIPPNNQKNHSPMPNFPSFPTAITNDIQQRVPPNIEPSVGASTGQETSTQLSEKERNRKDKKKLLERQRRLKINYFIKAIYDHVFEMSGEKSPKTEICDMLEDSLKAMETVYENVMEDPDLRARVLPPGFLTSKVTKTNTRVENAAVSPMRKGKEVEGKVVGEGEEVKNVPSGLNEVPLSLVSPIPSSIKTTSTPVEGSGKRMDSTDSGLEQTLPSFSANDPNQSTSLLHEPSSSKGSRLSSAPKIWQPYL